MTSLHAVTPKTKGGSYYQGFRAGAAPSAPSTSSYPPSSGGARVPFSRTWDLTEHYDGIARKRYLLDVKTGLLYSDVPASDWPTLVAQLVVPTSSRERERVEPIDNYAATMDFFTSLDQYLKQQKVWIQDAGETSIDMLSYCNCVSPTLICVSPTLSAQVRFSDLFNHYDTKRRGELGIHEMKHLVREIMPKVTDAQIWLFQVSVAEGGYILIHRTVIRSMIP